MILIKVAVCCKRIFNAKIFEATPAKKPKIFAKQFFCNKSLKIFKTIITKTRKIVEVFFTQRSVVLVSETANNVASVKNFS